MAGPLGNAPEWGLGGRKRGEGGRGRADGNEGGHSGSAFVLFAFLGLPEKQIQKSKSNTRAEIEGNVCLREKNRAHAGGSPPVPPVQELILYISGSVSQLPVSGRFPVRAVPVRGSVREPS